MDGYSFRTIIRQQFHDGDLATSRAIVCFRRIWIHDAALDQGSEVFIFHNVAHSSASFFGSGLCRRPLVRRVSGPYHQFYPAYTDC